MEYLSQDELRRLLKVAYENDKMHHLCILVGFWHGLRVSEVVGDSNAKNAHHPGIYGRDIKDGQLRVKRLKRSKPTMQPLHYDSDPLLDESPLAELAKENPAKLFDFSRQWVDQFFKKYCGLAGIHPSKAHYHVLKHTIAMMLFDNSKSLGQVQSYLGHKAASSTLMYLYESDASKAQKIVQEMKI